MDNLVQQKRQIQELEKECTILKSKVRNINKGSLSSTSNLNISMGSFPMEFRVEETMHQLVKNMNMDKHESHPSNQAQDDVMSKHVCP